MSKMGWQGNSSWLLKTIYPLISTITYMKICQTLSTHPFFTSCDSCLCQLGQCQKKKQSPWNDEILTNPVFLPIWLIVEESSFIYLEFRKSKTNNSPPLESPNSMDKANIHKRNVTHTEQLLYTFFLGFCMPLV